MAFDDWPEGTEQVAERTQRGAARWLEALREHGVAPPIDSGHAQMFDPPLTLVEQRHGLHVRFDQEVVECRFCQGGGDEASEQSTTAGPEGAV